MELDVMGLAQPNRLNPHPSFCLTESHDILVTVSTSAGEGRTDAASAGPPAQPPAPAVIPLHRLPALVAGPAPWPQCLLPSHTRATPAAATPGLGRRRLARWPPVRLLLSPSVRRISRRPATSISSLSLLKQIYC
jgi:hypothetical protein